MAYTYNPTPAEADLLSQIAARESSGNPAAFNAASQAAGLFQFVPKTWAWVSSQTGVGAGITDPRQASVQDQQTNALWLLRYCNGDPNCTQGWYASGCGNPHGLPCYPTVADVTAPADNGVTDSGPILDVAGVQATLPTSDLMAQLGADLAGPAAGGLDLTQEGLGVLPWPLVIAGAAVIAAVAAYGLRD
jgi:hypothetical protein